MKNSLESMDKLVNSFSHLPAVGTKTAQRYAYAVLSMDIEEVNEFAQNLINAKNNIHFCSVCGNWADEDICSICATRKSDIICVVKEPKDILTIEKIREFNGTYHVLHGTISPLSGRGPEDLNIKSLLLRISSGNIKEIIMATNSDVEGEATAMYISHILKPLGIKVSRLAQGISLGSEIEYQDEATLTKAFQDRKNI